MQKDFYISEEYRKKQSFLTKRNWQRGLFGFLIKREKRICARKDCGKYFEVSPCNPKIYCNNHCSAIVNNKGRTLSEEVRKKISRGLIGQKSPFKGVIKIPRVNTQCQNKICCRFFLSERWKNRKFCSVHCAMVAIGGQPTSPRAARAKAGVREDINNATYFYSR